RPAARPIASARKACHSSVEGHAARASGGQPAQRAVENQQDVARFERLLADGSIGALRQIAVLYRGDFLFGLVLSERPFEGWLTGERVRLHELVIQGLGRLFAYQQQAGDHEAAVQNGLRLLALDALQEPVHRAVMSLYAGLVAGRRHCASTSSVWMRS